MHLSTIVQNLGGQSSAATRIGVKRTTLAMWLNKGRVPATRIRQVCKATGLTPEQIRPDLFSDDAAAEMTEQVR